MKVSVASLVLSALLVSIAVAESPASGWHSDLDSAWKESQDQGQPILLFVTMDGCKYCTKMLNNTFADVDVQADLNSSYIKASVDGTKNPQVAQRLRVRAYPATFLVAPDTRVLDRIDGYISAPELRQRLARAQQALEKQPPRQAKLPE